MVNIVFFEFDENKLFIDEQFKLSRKLKKRYTVLQQKV